MMITRLLITERWFFGSSVSTPSVTITKQPLIQHKQSTTMDLGNVKEHKTANTPPMSHTFSETFLPTPGETQKRFTGLSSAETPAKKRRYASSSEIVSEVKALCSLELPKIRRCCALVVALDLGQEVEKSNQEGKTLAQYNDSPVCRCDDRVPKTWKLFVEDESLVPLGEALYYLAASRLSNYDVCIEPRVKLALKLQLRQVDNLTLLTRVDAIWKNRDSKTLKRFVSMKCRQTWWPLDGKVLLDETAVTEYQINRYMV